MPGCLQMPEQDPVVALARALIEQPSITPDDRQCQAMMQARLTPLGFAVERLQYGEVSNFFARRGQHGPLIVFAGHTDVVPTGPESEWHSPPFSAEIRDGMLYGRGSADMKGSLAAMIVACEHFLKKHPEPAGSIGFLITSDEEGPATDGTVRVMAHLAETGQKIDYCLVGEPSSQSRLGDRVRIGRRGSLSARLTVKGIQGHVAYPDQIINPIHRFAPALTELVSTTWDSGNAHFPATSFQVSNIQAGTGATNVVPGSLQADFNFRYSTELDESAIQQRVEAVLAQHELEFDIEWHPSGKPFLTRGGTLIEAVRESIREIQGFGPELSTGGGTSDGRFIAPYGTEVVELGPLNASIHKINERTPVADLPRLAEIYQCILEKLLVD
ncbi:MAG: succinyl-diaminopimelate desuccinylase [Gammaproteobacteria bacterium]|nr:succinyl-diaminopimelate desuccinylase [Gammaproteobacteria bacterium]